MKTLSISELCEKLKCKDERTVRRWCAQNNVTVYAHNKQYMFVYETHFLAAFDKPLIQELQKKYANDWSKVYQMIKDGNVSDYYALTELTVTNEKKFVSKSSIVNQYRDKYRRYADA